MAEHWDECKCGKRIKWDTKDKKVMCAHCGTEYEVDCDSVLVYWLKEKIPTQRPYTTNPK